MDYDKLIESFKQLEFVAYSYNINGEVLGMDCAEFESVMADAVASIETLRADLARVTAERDAAVEDLRKYRKHKCDCCYYADKQSRFPCADCQSPISTYGDGWKWHGPKKED